MCRDLYYVPSDIGRERQNFLAAEVVDADETGGERQMERKSPDRPVTKSGKLMQYEISTRALRDALRLSGQDEADFTRLFAFMSRADLARHYDLTEHQIKGVEEYYELDARPRNGRRPGIDDAEALAERVWTIIEPRIEKTVAAALGAIYQRKIDDGHNGPMYSA